MDIGAWLMLYGSSDCETSLRANDVDSLDDLLQLIEEEADLEFVGLNQRQASQLWPVIEAQAAAQRQEPEPGPEPGPEPVAPQQPRQLLRK